MTLKTLTLICFTLSTGEAPPVSLTLETDAITGKELREHIVKKFDFNKGLFMICDGKFVKDDDYITDGSIITLTKWKDSVAGSVAGSVAASATSQEGYSAQYTGAEVKQALKTNAELMFLLMHNIAKADPFFLSYLAVNPVKAKHEMDKYLDQEGFSLKIKGKDSSCDPFKPTYV